MSVLRPRILRSTAVTTALLAGLAAGLVPATVSHAAEPASGPAAASAVSTGLLVENSFVSSVGWVKPGETYPSRIIVTNPTATPVLGATVEVSAPTGTSFTDTRGPGTHSFTASTVSWDLPEVPAASGPTPGRVTLVLENTAATTAEEPTIVWRDLSTSATLTSGGSETVTSHGPKVIPPSETYDTARYGDRPFPVVPVAYTDRDYQAGHTGQQLEGVINSPDVEGSTFNLFQEMSLGQLFPEGTVPSSDLATADFTYAPGFDFTNVQPGQTCGGATLEDLPVPAEGTPAYPERIHDGVYQLPGDTGYYGSDANGTAIIGSVAGVGALQNIDSGCGPAGKLVYDAAVIADPEIDYSDYDTDKDGVVDFFMAVFAGCGGNGASQLSTPSDAAQACPYDNVSYDNVWPHSSSLEYYFSDPETGQAGYTTDDQLKDLEGRPLFYEDTNRDGMTTTDTGIPVYVRVGPYNVNPETAIDKASVISHEYGHSLGLPDFYSTGGRDTYGDWNLMATDKSQNMDAYSRQELGWVVPQVLEPGSSTTVTGVRDSKQDTGTITWRRPDGTPYTLTASDHGGDDGIVHNSDMYVAKLPGRQLLDPAKFATGDTASATHAWWSGSGNDFGCPPTGGRNLDLAVPGLADLDPGSTVKLEFKSLWDIEWDYDYGYVLTTTDGGQTYASHPSEKGYTTENAGVPGNVNQNQCQATYDNGLTGSSGSYAAGTDAVDRATGEYPASEFLADSYDISDLAGESGGALRFSYATDPGLARPGWFLDDVRVVATEPGKPARELMVTDLESDGGPGDPRIFNGGCREDLTTAQQCTKGWQYVAAGAEAVNDHAYYLEMRDRSGFDLDGNGQIDRDPIEFQPGLYLAYTDEAHGYGNAGTDDPPAQSPLDSVPDPGNDTPDLSDAAFTAASGRSTYSDSGEGHTDNYNDPSSTRVDPRYADVSTPWRFQYDCLGFDVTDMSGQENGPEVSDGDLTGSVAFTMGDGCGEFDYGYADPGAGPGNTPPTAAAVARPTTAPAGTPIEFDAGDSTDTETPADLDYSWDFGNGGDTKDATGEVVSHAFSNPGSYPATVTVTDPQGATDTATVTVTVTDPPGNQAPVARLAVAPTSPFVTTETRLSGAGSGDAETPSRDLTYRWSFGDGGSTHDASGRVVRTVFAKPGWRTIRLTVTDAGGRSDTVSQRVLVRRAIPCWSRNVDRTGSWRLVRQQQAPKGDYCDNRGQRADRDTMTTSFRGPQVDVFHGRSTRGGAAVVYIDGKRAGTVSFRSDDATPRIRFHRVFKGLGDGRHTIRLVVTRGRAYLEGFVVIR